MIGGLKERMLQWIKVSNGSSENTNSSARKYQVFLSFCGKDTRHGFTDFLYTLFDRAGIRTFRDDNEIRVGEEIGVELIEAIKESKISIPILSKNYASSKWCLREVEQMVKCRRSEGQKIYPIFYEIDPYDVRHQSGCYEEAFNQHQMHFNEETVRGWKEALTMVGQLKGPVKKIDGPQGGLANEVFEEVLLELKTNHAHLPEHLVGIDNHVKEMEKLLNVNSSDVRIVGIHGMGGLGKTTIAKVIYNKLSDRFQYCCFLENVGTRSQDLVKLQNELISTTLKRKFNDGQGIEAAVCGRKVFIVLDDVVEKSQFEDLAGKCEWIGSGSRIIVTTRNKEVLHLLERTCQIKRLANVYWSYYEPQLMSPQHSLQLFSKHAFMEESPPLDYIELSNNFVHYAAGLPLVLVTIGSSLIGEKDTTSWEEKLRELKEIPDEDVLGKLRISFNALDYEQQQIFLDIACFFIGQDKTNLCYMWDDLNFFPRRRINSLVLRSLVKVGDDDKLWMHDQLRDLGRKLVREENLHAPGERSRLWHGVEALEILKNRMIKEKVIGLCLDFTWQRSWLEPEEFVQLPNLRFLKLGFANLAGDFKHVFSNLRWLEWSCPLWNSMPTNFHLKNLLVLDLSCSNITDKWEGWSQMKMATKLKVIDLTNCYHLRNTSHISTFVALERLILHNCHSFHEIDPSIRNLTKLRLVDLSDCSSLTGILDCSTFTALENLDVTSCWGLRRLDGFEKLVSLRYLNLSLCGGLERFPDLSNLKRLRTLVITECDNLIEIQGIDRLESLEILDINGSESIERLPDLSNLRMLKKLILADCTKLSEVQGLGVLKSLEILKMNGCNSIERLPDLSNLGMLKQLDVSYCKKLHEVEGLSNLGMLKELDVSYCEKLRKVEGFGVLESLESLEVSGCISLERKADLSKFKNLKKLRIRYLEDLTEIEGLEELKYLELLDIDQCKSIEILDLSTLKNLKQVHACGCEKLTEIRGLEELKSLELLDIVECDSLENLPDLPHTTIINENQNRLFSPILKRSKHFSRREYP